MSRAINAAILLFVFLVVVGYHFFTYTVDETQQAIITRFGKPVGKAVTKSGLHFKSPLDQVNYFDKRILIWDGDAEEITTLDKRFIWVDTTARWKIVDALKFMQSVGNENSAQTLLDDILDGATRDAISNRFLVESIRNSNSLIERLRISDENSDSANSDLSQTAIEKIELGRDKLTQEILKKSSEIVANYGIELVDVIFKRINYVPKVQKKVYERMISERKRAAAQFRSEGLGKKAEIEGQMQKELERIQSAAYRMAQEVKGKADAEAIKIYADAYNKDPEFYAFSQTLETYKKTFNAETSLILNTNNDFYRYLKSASPDQDLLKDKVQ